MDYQQTFAVSAAGMEVERRRLDIAAMNLANAQTVTGPDGRGYRPQRVFAQAGQGRVGFDSLVTLPLVTIAETGTPERKMHEPGHPMADAQGYVAYPGIDHASEMMTVVTAMRAYEANVVAMHASREMALRALDIGSGT